MVAPICRKGWSGWWLSNNGSSHPSASSSHASSLRGHIQIASIFLRPAGAFSSSGAEEEEDGKAARTQGGCREGRRALSEPSRRWELASFPELAN